MLTRVITIVILSLILFSCRKDHPEKSSPDLLVVRTSGGLVSGSYEDSVFAFKGVPYAAPPVGDLRWKAPAPVIAWNDTLKCLSFGASPIQNEPKPFMMWSEEFITPPQPLSEDCLFLNIWSGARSASDRLPVFVWIHGGAFTSGSGACAIYNGAAMARKGIVFVSINYRLGVFGFLAHPELTKESGKSASGNYGLMDQVAALQWIKENIQAFGGDPSKVTIGGQSAGSMSVQALIASPLAKGLVHGAIAESGAGRQITPLMAAEKIGEAFAKSGNASSLAELRAIPGDTILSLANKMPFGSFFPIEDGYVLTQQLAKVFSGKQHIDVPLLAGWVTGDGALASRKQMNANEFKNDIKKTFGHQSDEMLKLFPAANDKMAAESQLKLGSMRFAGVPDYQWALANTSASYLYEFTYVPTDKPGFPNYGAFHTSEVPFALHTLSHWDRPWTETDLEVERYMSSYWLNFIRSGNPNGDGLPEWESYSLQNGDMIRFGAHPEPIAGLYKKAFELLSASAH
ncbi:carboxylesterase family protein [Chryseolinea sp. T2]|uniref:carboxylesterase/lipase family protein n=1 Tax=Chryseolinea sp. T2 TaxID=3129255 RepID=UPI003077024C